MGKSPDGIYYHLKDKTPRFRGSYWSTIEEENMNSVDFFLAFEQELDYYRLKTLGVENKYMSDRFMVLYKKIVIGYRKYKIDKFLKEN